MLREDYAYLSIKVKKLGLERLKFIFIPLFANSCCLLISMLELNMPEWLRIVCSAMYIFWCLACYQGGFKESGFRLTGEYEKCVRDDIRFMNSPQLPDDPPICNGYLYVIPHDGTYSQPYELKYFLHRTDYCAGAYSYLYTGYITINGKKYDYNGFSYFSEFKFNAFKDFEKENGEIVAIETEYGQYLWIKGDYFQHGKFYKRYGLYKIYTLKFLIFACIIMPVIWILNM